MSTRQKRKKQKDGGVRGFVFSSLSFVVICAALVFGMSVFFRVSNIEVTGADRYTQAEIVAASGIEDGDNLMFINRDAVAKRIYAKLIYIGEVTVRRKLPNTVVIELAESGAAAVLETDSGLWLIDRNCRLLERCKTQDTDSYIKVMGLSAVKPEEGAAISVSDEDKPKAAYLKGILNAFADQGITADVASLDLSNTLNVQFDYLDGRFTVKLGNSDNLDYKMELLVSVVQKLEAKDTGMIDLSQDKKAQFSPF